MSDTGLYDLYSERILGLAAAIPHLDPLPVPGAHGQRRAPMCGSTIGVDLVIEDGRIAGFSQQVRACALGQASAAIFGAQAIGRSRAEVQRARDQLEAMLKGGPVPEAPFDDYAVLQAARDYPARHGSILLALEATLAAWDAAES